MVTEIVNEDPMQVLHCCPTSLVHQMKIRPVTPVLDKENQLFPSCGYDETDMDQNPQTPTGSTFNPFAPGPEALIFAPVKKSVKRFPTFDLIQRKLDFNESPVEDEPLRSICRYLFDAIASPTISLCDEMRVSTSSTEVYEDMDMDLSEDSEITDESDKVDCKTPRESTVDTFGPGPEELMFAPVKKGSREAPLPVQRKLDYEPCLDQNHLPEEQEVEESEFLEKFYRSLLETILSCQCNGTTSSLSPTNASIALDKSMACPGAPIRKLLPPREFDIRICRKLQF